MNDAIIITISPANNIVPIFVKSIFVNLPISDIIANISDVNANIATIESILYAIKITENDSPVKNEYRQNSILAVVISIFLIPADSQIHTPISANAKIQYIPVL